MNINQLIERFCDFSEWWWATVFSMTWQSTVVCLLLLALVWFGRRWPSPLRYGILLVALAKFAVPPVMTLPINHWQSNTQPAVTSSQEPIDSSSRFPDETYRDEKEKTIENSSLTLKKKQESPVSSQEKRTEMSSTKLVSEHFSLVHFQFDWSVFFLVAHLAGIVVVGLWITKQWWRLLHIKQESSGIQEGELSVRMRQLIKRLKFRRKIDFRVSDKVDSPIAFGIFKPVIMLPYGFLERLSEKEQDAILAHELAHHVRKDTLVNWLQLLLTAVWWFNPVVWILNHEIRKIREDCCDDLLLLNGIASNDEYCETLLRAAAVQTRPVCLAASVGLAEPMHPLGGRIRRIMDRTLFRTARLSHIGLAIIVILACAILPVFLTQSGQRLLHRQTETYELVPTNYAFKSVSTPLQAAQGETILGYGTLQAMDCSADGRLLITAGGLGVFVWDLNVSKTEPVRWCPIDDETIHCIALSPNSQRIAMGSESGNLTVWDINQWEKLYTKSAHGKWQINETVFSPDGKYVLTGGEEGIVKMWESSTGDFVHSYRVRDKVVSDLVFSPDGSKILAGYERSGKAYLWDTWSEKLIRTFQSNSGMKKAVAFMPDGENMLLTASDYSVSLIGIDEKQTLEDFIDGGTEYTGHKREIFDLDISADGKMLVSGSNDGTAKVWDLATGREIQSIGKEFQRVIVEPRRYSTSRTIFFTEFIDDGKQLILGDHNGTIRIWDVKQQEESFRLDDHISPITEWAINPTHSEALIGCSDGTVKLQDLQRGDIIRTFGAHYDYVTDVAFSPAGKLIASLGRSGDIKMWEKESGESLFEIKEEKDDWFGSIAFSPDGKYLVAGDTFLTNGQYLEIKWLDVKSGEVIQVWKRYFTPPMSIPQNQDRFGIETIFFNEGKYALIPVIGKTKVWDVEAAKEVEGVTIGEGFTSPKAISPDNSKAILSSTCLEIWDIHEEKLLHTLLDREGEGGISRKYIRAVAYSADGKYLLSVDHEGTFRLWDLETYREIRRIHKPSYSRVQLLRFSPDDSKIYVGTPNGMRIWDRSVLFGD